MPSTQGETPCTDWCTSPSLQENLRQLCVFQLAKGSGKSWLWWDYVTRFGEQCTMANHTYDEDCAEKVRLQARYT